MLAILGGAAHFALEELRSSRLQSQYLAAFSAELYHWTEEGANPEALFPRTGPYNRRLGYTHIPHATQRLTARGYEVGEQGRMSARMTELTQHGIFPIYEEKSRAGLMIRDRAGDPIYTSRFPERKFDSFDELPELLVATLLFIENRELLDPRYPNRNPAVEWKRFAFASAALLGRMVGVDTTVFGGSTLATQIEKFRHSEDGRTRESQDKIQQMISASLRAYLGGENTWGAQQRIILDYVNGVPLAAVRGYGEVHGMADGLWAWYGEDPYEVMSHLEQRQGLWSKERSPAYSEQLAQQARAYRMVLSLLIAHRRPSYYLVQDPENLQEMTDQYLRVLANAQMISEDLRDRALSSRLEVQRQVPPKPGESFVERKAVDSIRTHLLHHVDVPGLYDLDRFDLEVKTTIDTPSQQGVTDVLKRLDDPAFVADIGLRGHRLLERDADLSNLVFSFTLYERTELGNVLRIQSDSFDQPMNINEQTKLDLGSTAKLRTLVTYLEVVAELHGRLVNLPQANLREVRAGARDNLTRWAADYLSTARDRSLEAMVRAAMARPYSGSPQESFFTGGGAHTFSNFDNRRNHVQSVSDAFRHSVNLVFIRMMRDIARYYMYVDADRVDRIMNDSDDRERVALLSRFADKEGRTFQDRFIRRYMGKDDLMAELVRGRRLTARRLAVAYRAIAPDHDFETFSAFVSAHATQDNLGEKTLRDLYERHKPGSFNLSDQGYLSRIHPLELWTAHYLRENPTASYNEIIDASASERQEVYRWLFRTSRKHQQDRRLRIMLEEEAFDQIHASWARLGYPFETLVPSYATSIGSSADRPAALAELVGVLVNGGMRLPNLRVESYAFAQGTPYETRLDRVAQPGERVLPEEVALVAREALLDVVEQGTARRIHKSFVTGDGVVLPIGGKTGTGDHRHKSFVNGRLVESRAVNRTATFAFFVADRFFGTLTVFVPGEAADDFRFTSALTVQLLKSLGPALMPLFDPASEEEEPQTPEALEEVPELTPEPVEGPLLLVSQRAEPVELVPSAPGLPRWDSVLRNALTADVASSPLLRIPWYERSAEDMPERALPTWRDLMRVEGTPLLAWTEAIEPEVELLVAVEAAPLRRRRPVIDEHSPPPLPGDILEELLAADLDFGDRDPFDGLRELHLTLSGVFGLEADADQDPLGLYQRLAGLLEGASFEEGNGIDEADEGNEVDGLALLACKLDEPDSHRGLIVDVSPPIIAVSDGLIASISGDTSEAPSDALAQTTPNVALAEPGPAATAALEPQVRPMVGIPAPTTAIPASPPATTPPGGFGSTRPPLPSRPPAAIIRSAEPVAQPAPEPSSRSLPGNYSPP